MTRRFVLLSPRLEHASEDAAPFRRGILDVYLLVIVKTCCVSLSVTLTKAQ